VDDDVKEAARDLVNSIWQSIDNHCCGGCNYRTCQNRGGGLSTKTTVSDILMSLCRTIKRISEEDDNGFCDTVQEM
jgi:hypothetical protein